jgi:hypothetical protein
MVIRELRSLTRLAGAAAGSRQISAETLLSVVTSGPSVLDEVE